MSDIKPERLQKILSQVGVCSRRDAEQLIEEGLVTVNGKVAKLGDKAHLGVDAIKAKGKLITTTKDYLTLAFYKPKGVISAFSDPYGRLCLKDVLGLKKRLYPVGRLDFNTEGLLFITNDGELAQSILQDSRLKRTYEVKIKGHADEEILQRVRAGFRNMDRKLVKPELVEIIKYLQNKTLIQVILPGGITLDLKESLQSRGILVDKIKRTAIGPISLKSLRPGEYRVLKKSKIFPLTEKVAHKEHK